MATQDLIVIGGSAGSYLPLKRLVSELPADLPASVFISTHIPADGGSYLAERLGEAGLIRVIAPVEGQPVERGCVYVARPDRHLMMVDGVIRLGHGPRENLARPAIDALFRSAAFSYGPRVIGVVLSGMLNDGASGLVAIKQRGGLAVVQHPVDAERDQMPIAALEAVNADHVAPAAELAPLLVELSRREAEPIRGVPSEDLELEVLIALGVRLGSHTLSRLATPSPLGCPHCKGVLSEIKAEGPLRYRCQIGHAFTGQAALVAQEPEIDEALRIALRVTEERVTLVTRMAEEARQGGRSAVAELYERRAEEYARYASTLRQAATLSLRLVKAHEPEEI